MSILLPDIKSKNWQISTAGVGVIAEGLQDIRQCLDIILRTTKGSDPLRPQFGSDIYQYADKPLTVSIPNVKRAILDAVEIWETRVTIKSITHKIIDLDQVAFYITYELSQKEQSDLLTLYVNGGFITTDDTLLGSLIINAFFPPNPGSRRYTVELLRNGEPAEPVPPTGGFATLSQLYDWVRTYWATYGTWHMLADRITGYLRPNYFTTASFAISITGMLQFQAILPFISIGESYTLAFTADGVTQTPPGETFSTAEAMLLWAQSHWASFGSWSLVGLGSIDGEFEDGDFGDDFLTVVPGGYKLVLNSETISTATITVGVV